MEQQRSIAVYRNARNHVAIRAEGEGYDAYGDDKVILLSTTDALKALIVAPASPGTCPKILFR